MSTFPEQIFIGIDVSKATLDLAFRGQTKTHQFANTDAGITPKTVQCPIVHL